MKRLFLLIIIAYSFFSLYNYLVKKNSQNILFNSLKESISQSVNLRCEYTNEEGQTQVAYQKDNFLRVEGVNTFAGPGTIILNQEKLWMWGNNSNKGVVFDISDNQSYFAAEEKLWISPQGIIEKIEYQKQNCSPSIVADSLFDLPKNIDFVEAFEFFKEVK